MSDVKCTCPECGLVFLVRPDAVHMRVRQGSEWVDENGLIHAETSPPGVTCPDCGAHAEAARHIMTVQA